MKPDGLTMRLSHYGPKDTMDRLAAAVTEHGFTVLARIDHAAAAAKVGMELRPTEVLIFGNPRSGTPLMQAAKTLGIDLPLKAMVWQDGEGNTCVAYYEPKWLAQRHGVPAALNELLETMTNGLAAVVKQATKGAEEGS
ncbi:MAG: hypothetical protein QOK44_5133 [Betaproteobacteria bacterium]|jgi:uncharacterized protein (DUF302 family)|nr:hypothetical protein [Betaproteobacteria bacterium]